MTRLLIIGALLVPLLVNGAPHHKPADQVVLAPGYASLSFDAPEPGSYELPVLGDAKDGTVLLESGDAVTLHNLFDQNLVVMSFIYTHCSDVNGCPLASYVLSKVQNRVVADDSLRDRVRFVSVSFDQANDSPQLMKAYGENFRREGAHWDFVTTESQKALQPILQDYDQFIIEDVSPSGERLGTISHVLRVYLIDASKKIRNIYSVSFLHPDIVWNDLLTIAE